MDSTPAIEKIHTDGTAEYQLQKYRYSATSNCGNPERLLNELNSKTAALPWISRASRDTALETVKRLPLEDDVKTSLVHHVYNTGYLKDSTAERVKIFFAEESLGFVGDGIACWGIFGGSAPWLLSHLVTDYFDALQGEDRFLLTMPFESLEIRDLMVKIITDWPEGVYTDSESELPELDQKMRGKNDQVCNVSRVRCLNLFNTLNYVIILLAPVLY